MQQHLLGEERVPTGSPGEPGHCRPRQRTTDDPLSQQSEAGLAQLVQPQGERRREVHCGLVPAGRHKHERRLAQGRNQLWQAGNGLLVAPVQVVDLQHHPLPSAYRGQQRSDGRQHRTAARCSVGQHSS